MGLVLALELLALLVRPPADDLDEGILIRAKALHRLAQGMGILDGIEALGGHHSGSSLKNRVRTR